MSRNTEPWLQRKHTKCIQRKQKKSRVLVYWLAFYWAEFTRAMEFISHFSALHFGIFPTTFRTVAPTLICKSKTRCTITTVLELICISQRNEKMLHRLYRNLSYTSTNIDTVAITQINRIDIICLRRARIWYEEKRLSFSCIYLTNKKCSTILTRRSSVNKFIYKFLVIIL